MIQEPAIKIRATTPQTAAGAKARISCPLPAPACSLQAWKTPPWIDTEMIQAAQHFHRFEKGELGGLIGIGFSLFVVVVAAMNLVLDFDFIETGAERRAPKYMEWYAAF